VTTTAKEGNKCTGLLIANRADKPIDFNPTKTDDMWRWLLQIPEKTSTEVKDILSTSYYFVRPAWSGNGRSRAPPRSLSSLRGGYQSETIPLYHITMGHLYCLTCYQ
jgi:hypothetical protein